ncbi:MAG: tight adherence protein [Nocardioidaceae bacterium]|nr:tight adherence protein [Nocardioidaceae bacterium]
MAGVRALRRLAGPTLLALGAVLLAGPAQAAGSSIDHIEAQHGAVQVAVSLSGVPDGATPDLGSAAVTFNGTPVKATAQPMSAAGGTFKRVAVLAMDVSASMNGAKFEEAKAAANAFLDDVPSDVAVGLVTFAGDVTVAQAPTQDTEAVRKALDTLQLSQDTRLYDGIVQAVKVSGSQGARSVLVLSDGRDSSSTKLATAVAAVRKGDVKVDVVALAQNRGDEAILGWIAHVGRGQLLSADDPTALTGLFAGEAEQLARQVLVTAVPPKSLAGKEGTLAVTLTVGDKQLTDEAFVALPAAARKPAAGAGEVAPAPLPAAQSAYQVPVDWMYGGLGAAGVAVLFILVLAFGGFGNRRQDAVDKSIEAYTRKGAQRLAQANREAESNSMTQQAVAVAESVLEGQKGLEAVLGARLEAAGLALKPAEWLIVHAGVAVGLTVFAVLMGGGNVLYLLVGLVLGAALPWLYLSLKKRRRLRAFKAQLADTLQLMAGSLSAGLSLAQSVDTVVREGTDPMAAEFRRALVETRLGVEIEDALNGVAERMGSVDFEWVVMAIRIQREVGGNLSELLNKVAETIREREYLERQVKTLSAEGRLSVWILGGLPPGFLAYLGVANPSYVTPLFTSPLGWVMLTVMVILLTAGVFWMKRVVKVEV